MAKFVLIALLASGSTWAQLFQNPFSGTDKSSAPAPALEKALADFEGLEAGQGSDERYQQLSLEIERQLDFKRSVCSETAASGEKQKCFRDLVGTHRRYVEKGFEYKRAFLKRLHEDQLSALEEARARALKELERSF